MTFPSHSCWCRHEPDADGKMPASRAITREIANYLGRISGPLLDRIDLHIEVPRSSFARSPASGPARCRANPRAGRRGTAAPAGALQDKPKITCNARMAAANSRAIAPWMKPPRAAEVRHDDLNLSARAYDRILKVARTIADLASAEEIASEHVSEAIQYRSLDRQIWT